MQRGGKFNGFSGASKRTRGFFKWCLLLRTRIIKAIMPTLLKYLPSYRSHKSKKVIERSHRPDDSWPWQSVNQIWFILHIQCFQWYTLYGPIMSNGVREPGDAAVCYRTILRLGLVAWFITDILLKWYTSLLTSSGL